MTELSRKTIAAALATTRSIPSILNPEIDAENVVMPRASHSLKRALTLRFCFTRCATVASTVFAPSRNGLRALKRVAARWV